MKNQKKLSDIFVKIFLVLQIFLLPFFTNVNAQSSSSSDVTVEVFSLADAIISNSTIDGIPPSVQLGDTITITVTIRGFGGAPLSGHTVDLHTAGLPGAIIVGPTLPTNASGVTTATLTSLVAGTVTVTGTDTTYPGNPIDIADDFVGTFTVSPAPVITIVSVAGDNLSPYYDYTDNGSTLVQYTTSPAASSCKWDIIDTDFDSMTNTCLSTTQCDLNLTGLGAKTVYLRCEDAMSNKAPSSYVLDYIIAQSTTPPGGGVTPPIETVCTPNCSCSNYTNIGQTCPDGCGGICPGTLPPEEICTPNCSCSDNTYIGQTCPDGCGGVCPGNVTPPPPPPPPPTIQPPTTTQPTTPTTPGTPGGTEVKPYYVPIVGWTFPNSSVSGTNEISEQNVFADVDGKFEMIFSFGTIDEFKTNFVSYFSNLGIYPPDIDIIIDEDTVKFEKPVYVIMPPTIKLTPNEIDEQGSTKIKGTAAPNSDISIYVYNQDSFRIYYVKSDQYGFYEYNFINDLAPNEYSIYSVVNNQYGFISLPSNIERLKITPLPAEIVSKLPSTTRIRQYLRQNISDKIVNPVEQVAFWSAIVLIGYSLFGLIFEIFSFLLFGLNQLASWLGIFPKRSPWGVVYDSDTKSPLDLAIVRLYEAKTKKYVESKVTDKNGRYGFLVKKGKYIIQVSRQNYLFPARGEYGQYDGRYGNLYLGGQIEIKNDDEIINLNIPITPKESVRQQLISKHKYNLRKLRYYLGQVSFPLLSLGFIVSIAIVLMHGGIINYFVMLTYLMALIYTIYKLNIKPKPWGIIYDAKTGLPVEAAIVKIIDPTYERILETKITDFAGRFSFMVVPGKYIIQVEKDGFSFPSHACVLVDKNKDVDWYCGQVFEIKSDKEAFINIDIPLDRSQPA